MARQHKQKKQSWRDNNEFLHLLPPKTPKQVQSPWWQPVEQRLPDDQAYVLAYDGRRQMVAYYQDGDWYEDKSYIPFGSRTVTHWMALPDAGAKTIFLAR